MWEKWNIYLVAALKAFCLRSLSEKGVGRECLFFEGRLVSDLMLGSALEVA